MTITRKKTTIQPKQRKIKSKPDSQTTNPPAEKSVSPTKEDTRPDKSINELLGGAVYKVLLGINKDLEELTPKERIAMLKLLFEEWDPSGQVVEDIPGMKIRRVKLIIDKSSLGHD